jgi:hypothetical protein
MQLVSDRAEGRRKRSRRTTIATIALGPILFFALVMMVFAAGGSDPQLVEPSAAALSDIPAEFLALYQQAGQAEQIDWAILAGIGKVECDHGRSQLAGCNPRGTVNVAGARGPMQFLGSTWRLGEDRFAPDVAGPPVARGEEQQGYATDGDGDGVADPWEPSDAIHAAARLLRANGAPANYDTAIWAYNHSDAYRSQVLTWAQSYRVTAAQGAAPAPGIPQGPVTLATVRGITVHSAIAPQVEAMLAAAQADGLTLTGGGYRTNASQIALRRAHCGTSDYAIYEMPAGQCSPPTARPGTSMHEQGLAIDFNNCSTRSTRCFQWLAANAARFGFRNLPSEPWHWSIDGR